MTHDGDTGTGKANTRIVFFHNKFLLGGIEILEVKLVKELSRLGYDVVIPSHENEPLNELYGEISGNFTSFFHSGYSDFIECAPKLASDNSEAIIFVSLHPVAAMVCEAAGRAILRKYKGSISVHHFHWVSHSRAFFFSERFLVQRLFKAFFDILTVNSTYFMNDAALIAHQSFWRRSLENYPILRIIGRDAKVKYSPEKSHGNVRGLAQEEELRIVSVGRLVPFKSYNTNAPMIVRRLRDAGIKASWDIWGYGPEESAIIENAEHHDVMEHIHLRGELPHDSFDETVSSYDIFVGMGTSVLEAANTGTPSCVAVENQSDTCYGYLHEAPTDSVGDRVEGFIERKLHEVLHAFALLNFEERAEIGAADAFAVKQRESTIDEFATAILSAEPMKELGWRERALLTVAQTFLTAKQWNLDRTNR